jgi:hypothetical protein
VNGQEKHAMLGKERCDFGLRPSETGFAFHGAGIVDFGKAKSKRAEGRGRMAEDRGQS